MGVAPEVVADQVHISKILISSLVEVVELALMFQVTQALPVRTAELLL